jgi:TRAP-type transport system periplasmic protein
MLTRNAPAAARLAAIALFAGSALVAPPALAQTELRLHTFVAPGHVIFREILEPWAQEVEEETGGELRITLYPSMQLGGGAPELARQAQEGTVDMVFTLPGYTSAVFPRTQMFELPGLAEDGVAATEMMWDLIEAGLLEEEYQNLKILALWAADDQNIYTRDVPIRSVDDIQGKMLRTPSAGQAEQIERLGATPVAMPITELYPQLERGVIDGALVPFTTILDFRMSEVANYYTITGPVFGRSQFLIAMNQPSFDRLPEEHQELLERTSGIEMSRRATEVYLARADEGVEFVRGEGKDVIEFDEEEQDRIRETLRPIINEWIAEMEGMGIDGRELLETAGVEIED